MTVSAGNLDGLVNLAGPVSELYGINFSGGTISGTSPNITVTSANVQVIGSQAPGTSSVSGGTFRITSVNDLTNSATLAFNINGVDKFSETVDVIGYTTNAILLTPDARTTAFEIQAGASYAASDIDFVLSTTSLSPGTTFQMTSSGIYNAPPEPSAPTSTQATVIGALGYVLTLNFGSASAASAAQSQLTPVSAAISTGADAPAAAAGGVLPSLGSAPRGLAEIDASQSLVIPAGYDTIVNVATGPVTIVAGTAGNHLIMSSGQGSLIYAGVSGADTVYAGGGNALVFGSGTSLNFIGGTGASSIVGGSVANTIVGGAGGQLIFGSSALNYVGGTGGATIVGAGNGNTVTGGAGNLLLFASSSMTYSGASGAATVIGGTGALNADLGAGGGVVYGGSAGGNALASSSSLASVLIGGGAGDVATAAGSGNDTLVAGGGAETLNGAASSGNLVFFGGTGPDALIGGSGTDLFIPGTGNETMTGGGGHNAYVFLASTGPARTDVITDFDTARNAIEFYGYGSSQTADAAALASATKSGNVTTVSLSDGTHIQFLGAPTLTAANFF